jgi:uncharacterized repeat protein (TIGR01451 family)
MPKNLLVSLITLAVLLSQPLAALTWAAPGVQFEANPSGGVGFYHYTAPPGRESGSAYLLRGAGGALWIAEEAIWLTAWEPRSDVVDEEHLRGVHLKVTFPDANPLVDLAPEVRLPGHVSIIKGDDPSGWQTELPLWGLLRYREIYPGVDLVIRSTEQGFAWEFELGPGADLTVPRMWIQGADGLATLDAGITLVTAIGDLRLPALGLRSDELVMTESRQVNTLQHPSGVIEVYPQAETEAEREIDPALRLWYSTFLGGSDRDEARDVAVDTQGNAYLAGTTWSADFPVTSGAFNQTFDSDDAFVAKINMGGGTPSLAYATYLGGTAQEKAISLAVEGGIAYVTGHTNSYDFPGAGPSAGENDVFVVALNQSGSGLVYSRVIGGLDDDNGEAIAVSGGQAYVTGITYSSDFPKTTGPAYAGNGDVFILKLNSSGNNVYARLWGSGYLEAGYGVAVRSGVAWVTGETNNNRNIASAFVISVSAEGALSSERTFGGGSDDFGYGIVLDDAGLIYVTGLTFSSNFPVTDGSTYGGTGDAFVAKLTSSGPPVYATFLGGSQNDRGADIALDGQGGVLVTGYTYSDNFSVTSDAYQSTRGGDYDAFLTRYTITSGNIGEITYSTYLGGTGRDFGYGLAIHSGVFVYIVGLTRSANFPITGNALYNTLNGREDAFFSVIALGDLPSVQIEKQTNGFNPGSPQDLYLLVGSTVTWTYVVTNLSQGNLTSIAVVDDQGVTVSCPSTTLASGASMNCSASGTAVAGPYSNTGTVTGVVNVGGTAVSVSATDTSHYFGANPGVAVEFKVNGNNADSSPGVYVLTGSTLTLDYVVSNTGNVVLSNLVVKEGATTICTIPSLTAGANQTCTRTTAALEGQQSASATVTATPPGGLAAITSAVNWMYYFGASPAAVVEFKANGNNADSAPGAYVLTGSSITLDYAVSNTGNVALTDLIVKEGTTTVCTIPSLAIGATDTATCRRTITALAGQQSASATVTATPPGGLANITSTQDWMYYFGASPQVEVEFKVNGNNADNAPGVIVLAGSSITLDYAVSNTGNVALSSLVVTDSLGYTCNIASLAVGATNQTCTRTITALAGQQNASATVTGTPPGGLSVITSAPDWMYYLGAQPAIDLQKKTNGFDADTPTGPLIKIGQPVTWTYEVTNSGNVTLTGIQVTDDKLGAITCPGTSLAAGVSMTCSKSGTAVAGQYANIGTVTGTPPVGPNVTDTDPSHYYGSDAGVTIKKLTNGVDTSVSPTPHILVGQPVSWTYTVTNIGNLQLTGVAVTDSDPTLVISCPGTTLAPAGTMTCTASGTAKAGAYTNTGYVEGTPSGFTEKVQNSFVSGYIGANPSIQITKYINGEHYPTPPGLKIDVDEPLTFTYQVSNPETLYRFTNVVVTDDSGLVPVCPKSILNPGESMTCTVDGVSLAGQQSYAGRVTAKVLVHATSVEIGTIQNSSMCHYYGGTGFSIFLPLILR